jgi:hypothetical protein
MKTAFRSVVAAALCGVVLLVFAGLAHATGGVNYKVKVENRTDFHCWITVVYGGFVTSRSYADRTIAPHSSATVDTGAKCPYFIKGSCGEAIYAVTVREFQSRCTLGPDCDNCESNCTATCWGSDWHITCKKTKDQVPLEDGDFTLSK